ncbi:Gfo/Idh/MocA family protein [Aeromicrobium sp. UC242_57]|uniref:Gfo/Idh/MocA family protein n=1 Tax=Aeromicrobium sp. UC242_57 TaxID=3374624 RepID=UPI00378F44AA
MTFPTVLPDPRTPDPMQAPPLRWAILGPGWIADQFVRSLHAHTHQQVVAVGSRALDRAQTFATTHGIDRAVGSYDELVALDEVDIVYIATPHPSHCEHALLAMDAGKHVLIEKPIALNTQQARQIAAKADETGLFCAEALWTLFLPKWDLLRQVVEDGVIGELRSVHTDYGEFFADDHRIFDASLAGGPLLDLGTYPVAYVTSLLGAAQSVAAAGVADPRGVNGQLAATMLHPGGAMSVIATTIHGWTRNEIVIVGSEGGARVEAMHNSPGPITVWSADRSSTLRYDEPHAGHVDGLHFQAAEAARCIDAGLAQTPIRPLAASIVSMEAMDEIRRQIGISFAEAGLVE